jgi:hypothetical protein
MRQEVILGYFKVLSRHFYVGIEEAKIRIRGLQYMKHRGQQINNDLLDGCMYVSVPGV